LLIGLGVWDIVLPVWYVLLVILGLGMLIFVHELGHFLVAKLCGVKVEKFYLGFDIAGWKLWKFRRGETEYGIGILPLGGYVKMLGQEDNPARLKEELERAKQQEAAAAAGADPSPAAEADPQPAAAPAGEAGDPPIDIAAAEQALYDPRSYLAQSVPKRMAIISAGVVMNVIFAFITAIIAYRLGVFQPACEVGAVAPGDAAWQKGFQVGDRIVEIAGKPTDRFQDLQREVSLGDIDQGVPMTIERPGVPEPLTLTIDPDRRGLAPTIGITSPMTTTLREKIPAWPGAAGAEASPKLQGGDKVVRIGETAIEEHWQIHRELALHVGRPLRITVERAVKTEDKDSPPRIERVEATVPVQPMRRLGLVMEMGPITAVQERSPAAEAGLQPDDVLTAIDGRPAGDPMTLADRLRARAQQGGRVDLTVRRGGQAVTLAGVALRKSGAFEEPFREKSPMSVPALGIAYRVEPRVVEVLPDSPAAKAGIKPGDEATHVRFLRPDEDRVKAAGAETAVKAITWGRFSLEKDVHWPSVFHEMQTLPPGARVELTLADGREVALEPQGADDWLNPDRGFEFEPKGALVRARTWASAVRLGSQETWDALTMVVRFLRKLRSGQVSFRAMGGPVSIFRLAYVAASRGSAELLLFLTMIGANLAILNILPIPVLDGGHLLFLIYEGITGRPPNERVQIALTWAGLLLILTLFVLVMGLDFGLIPRK
jgi:regulator of sigma E protease